MLRRKHNWQGALDRFLLDHRADRFAYGLWDCCLFVCGAIEVMTGVDLAATFRGRYYSHAEAVAAIRADVCKPSLRALVEKITAAHDMVPVSVLSAQRGDVVIIRRGKRDYSLGLVALSGREVLVVGRRGLLAIPLDRAMKGWR